MQEIIHLLGDEICVHARGRDTGGALTVVAVTSPPGGGPPLHTHPQTEVFVCVEGELQLIVDGAVHTIGPGESAIASPHVPHTYRNASSSPVRFIVSITPGGLDVFFAELAQATGSGVPDMAVVTEIAGRHGISLVS